MCRGFILGTWVKAIGRALDAAGCDGAALIAEAGFKVPDLDGPNARCSIAKTAQLWRIAIGATGDPAFGIKVASHIKHTSFHALGYGMSASSTLKEAFERVKAIATWSATRWSTASSSPDPITNSSSNR